MDINFLQQYRNRKSGEHNLPYLLTQVRVITNKKIMYAQMTVIFESLKTIQ